MSVVVISGNKQFLVNKGQKIIVDRLEAPVDSEIDLPVLGSFNNEGSEIKTIKAKVLKHQRGEKIRVVKYRAKSNYHKQYGYRHEETVLLIGGSEFETKKPAPKSKVVPEVVESEVGVSTETKKVAKTTKATKASSTEVKAVKETKAKTVTKKSKE